MMTTEIDRLIAMLEPRADSKTVNFVRLEIEKLVSGLFTSDYIPQKKLDDEVFAPTEDNLQKRTEQQSVEPFDEWLPNDPRNW
jgi:hypothetical protein